MKRIWAYAFWLNAAFEIYGDLAGQEAAKLIAKPLLMPLLVLYYISHINGPVTKFHRLMVAAFFFSWLGDVALMLVPKGPGDLTLLGISKDPNFFLVGLLSFLVTHLLYIFTFARVSDKSAAPVLPRKLWLLAPLALYLGLLLYILIPALLNNPNPKTHGLIAPVVVYTSVISTMVIFALNRYRRVNDTSFALVFGGALLFMFSDSLIAISSFVTRISFAGFLIMLLYIVGQFLIARGCLKQFELTNE